MKRIYTFVIVMFPILSIYRSPISAMDLGTFCFCLVGGRNLLYMMRSGKAKIMTTLMLLVVYSFLVTMTAVMLQNTELYSSVSSILLREFRFLIVLVIFSLCHKEYFDLEYGLGLLNTVSWLAAIYLIAQFLVHLSTGYILPKFIPGLTKLDGLVSEHTLSRYASFYRPTSFFLEPSSFVYFASLMLVYSLFCHGAGKQSHRATSLLLTGGILLSTSGQGLMVVIISWGSWFVWGIFRKQISRKQMIRGVLIAAGSLAAIRLLSRSRMVSNTVGRIFVDNSSSMSAVDARSGGYEMFLQLSPIRKLTGVGFGNMPDSVYFSSVADILFTLGIIGFLLVLILYLNLFKKGQVCQRMLCVVSAALMLGGGLFTATYLVFYLSFIIKPEWQFKYSVLRG